MVSSPVHEGNSFWLVAARRSRAPFNQFLLSSLGSIDGLGAGSQVARTGCDMRREMFKRLGSGDS